MARIKGYRTILVNAAAIVALVLDWALLNGAVLGENSDKVIAGLSLANILLRFITNTPVGKSGPP